MPPDQARTTTFLSTPNSEEAVKKVNRYVCLGQWMCVPKTIGLARQLNCSCKPFPFHLPGAPASAKKSRPRRTGAAEVFHLADYQITSDPALGASSLYERTYSR